MTCLPSTRSSTNKTPRKLTPADLIRRNKLSGGSFQRPRARPRASPGDDLRLGNQRHDMRGPFLQRSLALGMVIGAVIGASAHWHGQRHEMRMAVFGPRGRQIDYALTHVDFRPAQPANRGRPNERQRGFWRREAAGLVPVHLQARTACLDRWCMIYEGQ
jgi:hypothetical protein